MVDRRRVAAGVAGVVLAVGMALSAPAAEAASGPTSLPAGQFTLSSNYHQFDALNASLVTKLGTAAVHTVMDNANHTRGTISDADTKALPGYSSGFAFDSGDSSDCKSYPQGITTSRDAVGTANSGNYDGHQLVLVSWYTKDACGGAQERSRITLVDWDATYPNMYRKILLVEPTGTSATPSFKDIPIHAGGVSWYGDRLYVADTGKGMRVFDMTTILRTNTGGTSDDIGRQPNGTYYAHNYAYVLPQVGTVTASTTSGTALSWSSISLDRVTKSIVMTEFTCQSCATYPNRAPRAVRFPFASGSTAFAATTTATEALQLPWYGLNGVASHNGRWWFNSSSSKTLYYWTPAAGASSYPWVGGGESISYWEDTTAADLLWTLQEGVGHRNVFSVKQATYSG